MCEEVARNQYTITKQYIGKPKSKSVRLHNRPLGTNLAAPLPRTGVMGCWGTLRKHGTVSNSRW